MTSTRRPRGVIALALTLGVLLTATAGAAPGELDPTFGGDGRIALLGAGAFAARAVAIDDLNRIVVAGYYCEPAPGGDGTCLADGDSSFRIARLTPDGGLDGEFGDNGVVTTPLGEGRSQALDVVIDQEGRIVAGGVARLGGRDVFALARYLPDGSLDGTFGSRGIALDPAGSAYAQLGDIELGPDGTYLGTGQAVDIGDRPRMVLARFTATGALDDTFGSGGITFAPPAYGYGLALGVAHDRPVAAGVAGTSDDATTYRFGVFRTLADGSPDASFDADGYVEQAVGTGASYATAAEALPDGGVMAAGAGSAAQVPQGMAAASYRRDGKPGRSAVFGAGDAAVANDLVIDRAGRALLIGQAAVGSGYRFAVVRLRHNGSRDTGFGPETVDWPEYPVARATAGALQSPDRLVTAGIGCDGGTTAKCTGGSPVLLVARLEAGEDVPAIRTSVARRVSRARLRRGLRVRIRLARSGTCEAWLSSPRRTLAHVRAQRAGTRFDWVLHARHAGRIRARHLRLEVRAGNARVTRALTLTR